MSFCPNCGTQVTEGAKFCPGCGYSFAAAQEEAAKAAALENAPEVQPTSEAPEEAPKKKSKSWVIILIAALALIAIAAVITAVILIKKNKDGIPKSVTAAKTPYEAYLAGDKATAKALGEWKIVKELKPILEEGSTELKLAGDSGSIFGEMEVSILAQQSKSAKRFALKFGAKAGFFNMDILNLQLSDKNIALSSLLFGDKAYGITFADIAKNLKNSPLYFESLSDFALPEEVCAVLENLDEEKIAELSKLLDQGTALLEEAAAKFMELQFKYGKSEDSSETVNAAGVDVDCVRVTLTMDEEAMKKTLSAFVDWAEENETMKAFIELVDSIAKAQDGESSDSVLGGVFDDAREEIENFSMKETHRESFFFSKANSVSVKYLLETGEEKMEIVFGPDASDVKELRVFATDGIVEIISDQLNFSGGEGIEIIYRVLEDSKAYYRGEIVANGEALTIAYERDNGKFSFILEEEAVLTGTLEKDSEGVIRITVDAGEASANLAEISNISVTMTPNVTLPEELKFDDILAMNESEITNLLNMLEELLDSFSDLGALPF